MQTPDNKENQNSKNNKPRVSIGMPIYNAEKYLRESLDALLAQTYSDFELIISDNASTDATEEICREYQSKDSRIRYYRNQTNLGGAKNFNRVFELSGGEYFKWAAYDDLCAPEFVERCVEVLDSQPSVVLCYPKGKEIDEEGREIREYTEDLNIRSSKPQERFYQLFETNGLYHGVQTFGVMRSSALRQTLLLGNYPHADRALLAELALRGEFCEVPEYLFERRIHEGNSIHKGRAQKEKVTDEVLANWFDPKNKGKLLLPRWRRYYEYWDAVGRADLSWDERISCYLQIMRRLFISPGFLKRVQGMMGELMKVTKVLPYLLPRQKQESKKVVVEPKRDAA